jgi:hypothetical protein
VNYVQAADDAFEGRNSELIRVRHRFSSTTQEHAEWR